MKRRAAKRAVRAERLAALVMLGALAWSSRAAADGSRVVILRERETDAVVARAEVRLTAELRAAGFAVEERLTTGDDARDAVEGAEGSEAFATVLLRRTQSGTATDVWVADHVTHKTVVRRVKARGAGDAGDRSLALRVVELMRASLVEGIVLSAPAEGVATPAEPPPPDVAIWAAAGLRGTPPEPPETLRRVVVALGAAGVFAGSSVGLAVAPQLRVAWRASPAWSLALFVAAPAWGGRVAAAAGTATLLQEVALGEVELAPPTRGLVSAFVAVGAGGYHVDARGTATAPYTNGSDDAWSGLVSGGGGLRLRVSSRASVVADVRELVALPRPVVTFAGQAVATALRPGTLGGLAVAVDL